MPAKSSSLQFVLIRFRSVSTMIARVCVTRVGSIMQIRHRPIRPLLVQSIAAVFHAAETAAEWSLRKARHFGFGKHAMRKTRAIDPASSVVASRRGGIEHRIRSRCGIPISESRPRDYFSVNTVPNVESCASIPRLELFAAYRPESLTILPGCYLLSRRPTVQ